MQGVCQKNFKHVIIVFLLVQFIGYVHGDECVDVSNPQIRSFQTLLNLQSNKESFKAGSPDFSGNYITIQENLENLGRNSFIGYTSKYIIKIFLNNHQLKQIEEGAFISLDCVMVLDLHQNLISSITRDTFQGLAILHELNLGENNLREVPEHAFSLLPRLKVLNLTRNAIKVLHSYSFYNLFLLEQLDLSYNHLHQFTPDFLQYFKQLINMQLGSNQLDRMEFEKWQLPRLQKLNLSNNVLVSFDMSYDFTFGASLKELYLNKNYLTQINPYGLRKQLPNLSYIDIDNNPWSCLHLSPLVTSLNDTRVSFIASSNDGGPNINGIACNRSMDLYTINKTVVDKDAEARLRIGNTTTVRSTISIESTSLTLNSMQLIESLKKTNTIVVALFIVVIVFIIIDISIRTNLISYIVHRLRSGNNRNVQVLTNDNIENACLLRDRILI